MEIANKKIYSRKRNLNMHTAPFKNGSDALQSIWGRLDACFHLLTSHLPPLQPDFSFPAFIGITKNALIFSSNNTILINYTDKASLSAVLSVPPSLPPRISSLFTESPPEALNHSSWTVSSSIPIFNVLLSSRSISFILANFPIDLIHGIMEFLTPDL